MGSQDLLLSQPHPQTRRGFLQSLRHTENCSDYVIHLHKKLKKNPHFLKTVRGLAIVSIQPHLVLLSWALCPVTLASLLFLTCLAHSCFRTFAPAVSQAQSSSLPGTCVSHSLISFRSLLRVCLRVSVSLLLSILSPDTI